MTAGIVTIVTIVYYWLARVTKELIGKPISWPVSPDIPDRLKRFLTSFGFDESWHHALYHCFFSINEKGVGSEKSISWPVSPDIPDHALAIVHDHMEWHRAVVQHDWTVESKSVWIPACCFISISYTFILIWPIWFLRIKHLFSYASSSTLYPCQ